MNSERLEKGESILKQLSGDEGQREMFGIMEEVFPDFLKMTKECLFGETWSRPRLSLRDRMMITLAALLMLRDNEGLKTYMRWALNIGISREEILEIMMHLMFYGGWLVGEGAVYVARDVFSSKE